MKRRAVISLIPLLSLAFFFGAGAALAAPDAEKPKWLTPDSAWVVTYLLNAAFAQEYLAVIGAQEEGSRQRFMTDAPGRAIWPRAAFALAKAMAKNQRLGSEGDLAPIIASHATLIGVKEPATVAHVEASFATPEQRAAWARLGLAYEEASPTCAIDFAEVKAFAEHQRNLFAQGRAPSATALLKPIASWSEGRIKCLLFTFMSASPEAKAEQGFEPLNVVTALMQTAPILGRDPALCALLATRHLQLGLYPESLRAIMELIDLDPAFRVAYDSVQRIFSVRQKGKGSALLQGP